MIMMNTLSFKTTLFATATLILVGCNQQNQATVETASHALENGDYCFKETFSNGDVTDVQELKFSISGRDVTGEYNWLPQFKDRRVGKFGGTVAGSQINAAYEFSQEGTNASTVITITVEDDKAIIEGGAPELGLGATISKIQCAQ